LPVLNPSVVHYSALNNCDDIGYGDVCWDLSSWAWQIMPEYGLSRLNIGSKGTRIAALLKCVASA
jgi:hypothetical protein